MESILFFGDSFTEASNNNFNSFVNKMKLHEKGYNIKNFGVSGTTLAPYSLYPVGNNDLLHLLEEHTEDIKEANIIFLEYGINDFTAVSIQYVQYLDVAIAFTKCLDYITQINSNCEIIYLIPSFDKNILKLIAKSQQKYLEEEYLNIWDISYNSLWFVSCFVSDFLNFIKVISKKVEVAEMIPDKDFMLNNLGEDNIHPNNSGYERIAGHVLKQLEL